MKMNLLLRAAAMAVLCLTLVSCASGPSFSEASAALPPIPKGQGRVFVYRTSSLGAAVRPDVKIDGQVVGTSQARGFFHSDQPAGQHEISVQTEWKHKNTIQVVAGQPTYVQCKLTLGFLMGHLIPNQVSPETGRSEIQECKQSDGR